MAKTPCEYTNDTITTASQSGTKTLACNSWLATFAGVEVPETGIYLIVGQATVSDSNSTQAKYLFFGVTDSTGSTFNRWTPQHDIRYGGEVTFNASDIRKLTAGTRVTTGVFVYGASGATTTAKDSIIKLYRLD